ncbi:MAG TPA: zinc ribbon domain-containing protein [Ktedonobacterales bacterium]
MPTYEYLCKTCGHRFETWQKMSDEPLTVCPNCGAEIHRVLFATGVVFKGSGFYSTETRAQPSENGSSETPAASAASANSDSGAKDTSTKSDAPATAPAASSSTSSTVSGSKASASKDSGKDS